MVTSAVWFAGSSPAASAKSSLKYWYTFSLTFTVFTLFTLKV